MNDHIKHIAWLLQETYNGHPWHGRSIKALLGEVSAEEAVKKPGNNSFSIAELVYHMYTWRDFTITRLRPEEGKNAQYYEENDWRKLNLTDPQVWQRGLQLLDESQQRLVEILEETNDSILAEKVAERKYNFKFLLYGLVQHDTYHIGQIAYIKKLLS